MAPSNNCSLLLLVIMVYICFVFFGALLYLHRPNITNSIITTIFRFAHTLTDFTSHYHFTPVHTDHFVFRLFTDSNPTLLFIMDVNILLQLIADQQFKPHLAYLKLARDCLSGNPLVSYWALYYVLEQGIKTQNQNDAFRRSLGLIMSCLEKVILFQTK